jgi:hypothetical protein
VKRGKGHKSKTNINTTECLHMPTYINVVNSVVWLQPHQCILIDYFNNCNFSKLEYALPDDGDCTETCRSCFNVNFNAYFKNVFKTIHLRISLWINNFDNIKMHSMYVETCPWSSVDEPNFLNSCYSSKVCITLPWCRHPIWWHLQQGSCNRYVWPRFLLWYVIWTTMPFPATERCRQTLGARGVPPSLFASFCLKQILLGRSLWISSHHRVLTKLS